MTGLPLADLTPAHQADVLAALAAVETADTPVAPSGFRGLLDRALRATLERCLGEQGRVLLRVGDGYLSGYDNRIGQRLAAAGIGVLRPDDRAVLALVLLHSVAIPRAAGRVRGQEWAGEPTTKQQNSSVSYAQNALGGCAERLGDQLGIREAAGRVCCQNESKPRTAQFRWNLCALLYRGARSPAPPLLRVNDSGL